MPDIDDVICPDCHRSIRYNLLRYVYENLTADRPRYLQFYCPWCKVTLDIKLEWTAPEVKSAKILGW